MIFDTTELDNKIAQLKAERDRLTQINEAATQYLSGLADLIDQLDHDTIAKLKDEVLAIFPDGEPETIEQQAIEAITDTPDVKPQQDYYQLVQSENSAIACFRKHDGQIGSVYIGGQSMGRLQAWGDWLLGNGYITTPVTPRHAKRLGNWIYELKIPQLPMTYLNDLITLDFTRYPVPYSPSSQVLAA